MSKEETTKDVVATAGSGNKFVEAFKGNANDMLMSYFGQPHKVARFYSAIRMCFAINPKLKECSIKSLSTVFMTCAEVGLYPSTYTGECYVIPYKIKGEMTATFQLGYQGMITLGYRSGIKKLDAQIVYSNDIFNYQLGLKPVLDHRPDVFSDDRGTPIGAYAIAILSSNEPVFKLMSASDIYKHRDKSQSWQSDQKFNNNQSPWQPENDPQLTMWTKTCLRQLFKLLPKSSIMQQAITADMNADIIDVTPEEEAAQGKPNSQDIIAFLNEAREYLKDAGFKTKKAQDDKIEAETLAVTDSTTLENITTSQLNEIKARIFTGEVIDSNDTDNVTVEGGQEKLI